MRTARFTRRSGHRGSGRRRRRRTSRGDGGDRVGRSVPSNIVEGNARQHTRDKLNFFNIASASLSEVTYGLHAARRLGYIEEETYRSLDDLTRMVAAPLNGLIEKHRATQVVKGVASALVFLLLATPMLS
ncbi:MAG: four helix bundle protein [Vicinamibacterales bacterium]